MIKHQFEIKDESSPLIGQNVDIKTLSARSAYALYALTGVLQAVRSTAVHGVLKSTQLPIMVPLAATATVFLILSTLGTMILGLNLNLRQVIKDKSSIALICTRGILFATMLSLSNLAYANLDTGLVATLLAVSPIFGFILSYIFLNDKLYVTDWLIFVVNFLGIYLVARRSMYQSEFGFIGVMSAICCAISIGACFTLLKVMCAKVPLIHNLFSIGLGTLVTSLFLLLFNFNAIYQITTHFFSFRILVAAELFTFTTQIISGYIAKIVRPGTALILRTVNVPTAFLLSYIFLNEEPNATELVGVGLVLSSVITGCILHMKG